MVGYDHPDATALVARVQLEYVERYGSPDESPVEPSYFDPPDGIFLVGYLEGVPVASGGWRRSPVRVLDGTSAVEIKRMYVVPERRGEGIARLVLTELERTAAEAGHDLLVLETGLRQPEAIELYRSSGYVEVPGFGHYCGQELSRCFGRRIDGATGSPRARLLR
ncbi:GNAT family N-acetyltransferase [Nocardioides sp.]|nr:GNAT family N-acetyltransferase [Nocardioides sp.]